MPKIRLDQTDLNARNNRIENVASATAGGDAVNYAQLLSSLSGGTGSGSGQVSTLTSTGAIGFYSASASISGNPDVLFYDNGNISNIVSPTLSSHLVNKQYVDSISSELSNQISSISGFVSLTGDQTVSGNKLFTNITVSNPTDGSLNDGFFDTWQVGQTKLQDMLDDISEAFLDLAPAKAGLLTGNLTLAGTTKYSAILPSGLSSSWYVNASSGNTVSDYIVDGTYSLASPNQSTAFRTGKANDQSTRGIIYHFRSNQSGTGQITSYSASSGVGSSGTIQVTSSSAYNTFWHKTNAQLNITQTAEGYEGHYMSHTDAGTSNQTNFYYDPVNSSPSFSVNPIVTTASVFYKYLSNVPYYTSNTIFNVSFTGASGIFNRAYHPTNVSLISGTGGSAVIVNPSSVPNYLSTFPASGQFTLNVANRATNIKVLTVTLYKPNGTTTSATGSLLYGINTFGTSSTTANESFFDETYRLEITSNPALTATWNSLTSFNASNTGIDLQVRNGILVYPVTSDYGSFTNPTGDKLYRRLFNKASANGGNITFNGFASVTSSISSYNIGSCNVFLYLSNDNLWFDLGRSFGSNNGDGTGSTSANSKGARVSSTGNALTFSFGTNSTAGNNNQYQMFVVFKNNTPSLSGIFTS